jgi:hypothetical protein
MRINVAADVDLVAAGIKPPTLWFSLDYPFRQIETISAEIAALDTALRKENKASELGPRLETIPSAAQ